jgi:hypothetical protein
MYRGVVLAVALVLCAGCAPELNWREWRSDEAGLVQAFPCKPVRQQRNVQLAGRELLLVLQVCDADGVTWALAHAAAPDPAAVNALLDALSAAAHANIGATRGAAQPAAVPGATPQPAAGRYTFQGRSPQGAALQSSVLVFARGMMVVQLTVLGPRVPEAAVDTFFGSVRAGV